MVMLLMDIGTAVADIREFKIEGGVTVIRMPAEEFNGEYKQTSPFYLLVLWAVSVWAMVTNLAQIFFIKIFKNKHKNLLNSNTKKSGSVAPLKWPSQTQPL